MFRTRYADDQMVARSFRKPDAGVGFPVAGVHSDDIRVGVGPATEPIIMEEPGPAEEIFFNPPADRNAVGDPYDGSDLKAVAIVPFSGGIAVPL